jgi:hypothetical protein
MSEKTASGIINNTMSTEPLIKENDPTMLTRGLHLLYVKFTKRAFEKTFTIRLSFWIQLVDA